MRIITYDELKDSYQFLRVMDASFGWAATAERVAKIRKIDERYKYPYGFCLMKGETLAGFVGVMDIPVKTLDGKIEKIGGIHVVATYPAFSRQGISKTLMEKAHVHFKKLGYRFSFLWTSHSLVAHSLYEKLGYADVPFIAKLPRAYKFLPEKKTRASKRKEQPAVDTKLISSIYEKAMQNKTGFAVRIKNWVEVLLKARRMNPEFVIAKDGYAIADNSEDALFILEFIADKPKTYLHIIDKLKKMGKPVLSDVWVHDPILLAIYQKLGFRFRYGTYASLMVKPLTNVSFEKAFGDNFYFTPIDGF
jgi:predicted acetyltransferase